VIPVPKLALVMLKPKVSSLCQIYHNRSSKIHLHVSEFIFMQSPDCRRLAPLSSQANHPVGARPSKCIIIIKSSTWSGPRGWLDTPKPTPMRARLPTRSPESLTPCSDDLSWCCLNSLVDVPRCQLPQSCFWPPALPKSPYQPGLIVSHLLISACS
jgi:hypothetical protein